MSQREDLSSGYRVFERQTARPIKIKELLKGEYVKEEGWSPNYIIGKNGIKITKVNLIGAVISREEDENFVSIILDDGTGKIEARAFEKKDELRRIEPGEVVMVVGKPREYGERYVLVEIAKRLEDKRWLSLRRMELSEEVEEKKEERAEIVENESAADAVINAIKEIDDGSGADFEKIIEKVSGAEEVIRLLLKEGEIFEVKPGKLKVLE